MSSNPNYAESVAFLKEVQPNGPWCLWALDHESRQHHGRRFAPREEAETEKWIREQNAQRRSVYYRAAAIRPGVSPAEAKDEDVIGARFAWVDADYRVVEDRDVERARLLALGTTNRPKALPEPTYIVGTGNGMQYLFVFAEPQRIGADALPLEDFREINYALAMKLDDADKCHAPNHLLRLPGTINWKKPQPDGTYPIAGIIKRDGPKHESATFARLTPPGKVAAVLPAAQAPPPEAGSWKQYASAEEIPVSAQMQHIIKTLTDPIDPARFSPNSNNEPQWTVTLAMAGAGMSYEQIAGVLTDPKFKVHEAIFRTHGGTRNRPDWRRYLDAQIRKAQAKVQKDSCQAKVEAVNAQNTAAGWITNEEGRILPENQHNMRLAIQKLGAELRYNVFANRMLIVRDGKTELLNDARSDELWFEIDREFRFRPGYQLFQRFTAHECWRNSFHPVREYLDSVQPTWDGKHRIDNWLTIYGGAEESEYTRSVGRIVLVAAVRRIRQPGCKFDEMLILESEVQGKNKSTALSILAVKDEWFNDTIPLSSDVNRKVEAMQGKWIIEAGELHGMKEAGAAKLKNFLSSRTDCTRLAWEKKPDEYPRQCVIIGTTNKTADYFTDETGNRRYWPVKVRGFDPEALRRDRDQLWAEAAQTEAAGTSIRLDPSLYQAAGHAQEHRREVSPIEQKLAPLFGPGNADGRVLTDKIWEVLGVTLLEGQQRLGREVGKIMRAFGWERKQIGSERQYYYVRGADQRDLFPPGE